MRPIAILVFASLVLASACGRPDMPARQNDTQPGPSAQQNAAKVAQPAANLVSAPEPSGDPGPAGMSPSHRRAYAFGYRDCREGRYEPDRHSEAYRIGCAAAQDR